MKTMLLLAGSCVASSEATSTATTADTAPPPPAPPPTYALHVSFVEPSRSGPPVPLAAGLCADLVDPTPVGEYEPRTGVLDAQGQVTFTDIYSMPSRGWLLSVDECRGATTDRYRVTATLVPSSAYGHVDDGETIEVIGYGATNQDFDEITAAVEARFPKLDDPFGFVLGFVRDGAGRSIAGVVVTSPGGPTPVLYFDDDPSDSGPFAQGDELAQATSTSGAFVAPSAEVGTWSATHASGAFVFEDQFFGSFPGVVTVFELVGSPNRE